MCEVLSLQALMLLSSLRCGASRILCVVNNWHVVGRGMEDILGGVWNSTSYSELAYAYQTLGYVMRIGRFNSDKGTIQYNTVLIGTLKFFEVRYDISTFF